MTSKIIFGVIKLFVTCSGTDATKVSVSSESFSAPLKVSAVQKNFVCVGSVPVPPKDVERWSGQEQVLVGGRIGVVFGGGGFFLGGREILGVSDQTNCDIRCSGYTW